MQLGEIIIIFFWKNVFLINFLLDINYKFANIVGITCLVCSLTSLSYKKEILNPRCALLDVRNQANLRSP